MLPAKDGFVLIRDSVFPEKVGKFGIVTRVDPGWENPYEVDVPGGTTSRFRGPELQTVSAAEVLRMHNTLAGAFADLERRIGALEETTGIAP